MHFRYFVIISPWKRTGLFKWTNLNPHHPRMLCAKIGWNWEGGLAKKIFWNFFNLFSLFRNYPPLKNDEALKLNKLEFPWSKNALYQVWLKLVQWLLSRRWKYEHFTTTTTTTLMKDFGQILIRKAHLRLRWTNKKPTTIIYRIKICSEREKNQWSNQSLWNDEKTDIKTHHGPRRLLIARRQRFANDIFVIVFVLIIIITNVFVI